MVNKRVISFATAFSVVALTVFILWQVNEVVIYFLLSLILGAIIRPFADYLKGKSRLQVILSVAGLLLIIAGFGYLLYLSIIRLSKEVNLLVNTISNLKRWFLPVWLERLGFARTLLELLPPPGELFEIVTNDGGKILLPVLQNLSSNLVTILSGFVVIIFLSIYWTGSQDRFERLWLSLLSVERRQKARMIWRQIDASLGDYGRFLLVKFLLTWILISFSVYYLGSPYPVLLGLGVALANLLPIIGVVLALFFTLAIGLLSSILFYPWLLGFVLLVLTMLSIFVWPKLYQNKWDAPILRLLLLLIIGETMGLRWLILAPPLAVTIQIIWNSLSTRLRKSSRPLMGLESLKLHQDNLSQAISDLENAPPALTNNIIRLNQLVEEANQYFDQTI
ncbi:MAG: AI-2E family transporter [Chloroflexi bacterium]|nr:AI-2E family transporter [Chloroflexota bacterium]